MPPEDQYMYTDPSRPWKWTSGGNGGYHMYYKGKEVTPSALEYFLNQHDHDIGMLVEYLHSLLTREPITKG